MSDAAKVQALPVSNPNSKNVLDDLLAAKNYFNELLIDVSIAAELKERVALGIKKYGTQLQSFNDRDVLLDVRQELLDGVMYTHQGTMEGFRCAGIRNKLVLMIKELDELKRARW